MIPRSFLIGTVAPGLFALMFVLLPGAPSAQAGIPSGGYQVLAPIRQGNLTIFPVVGNVSHDTGGFLTLDEGLRSGEVVVSELGRTPPMVRPPQPYVPQQRDRGRGAEVNRLVLENNSKRPLLLLAGEIVTGGKQDRIVGKDLIIPAGEESDLSVFCVEPGRWTGTTAQFGFNGGIAQPSIRMQAMANKDQSAVWNEVTKSKNAFAATLPAPAAAEINGTSSYARALDNDEVKHQVETVAKPIERSYDQAIRELRSRNALGVVVAVNGRLVWADVFASTNLLGKYWPKLARSYAAQAVQSGGGKDSLSTQAAQDFLDQIEGRHQTSDSEPGVYRYTEITGDGFKAFELTSLLPRTGFELHIAKMAD